MGESPRSGISSVIISYNEEATIARCVQSCLKVSDEVILIDSFSNDATIIVAGKEGAIVHQEQWKGYGHAKNLGAKLASNDWILSLDADEILDFEAESSILSTLKSEDYCYAFKRINYIGNTPIRYGEWNPDIKSRLYNKNNYRWNDAMVHEKLISDKAGRQVVLEGKILHFSYSDLQDMEDRLEHYAHLSAQELQAKSSNLNPLTTNLKPSLRFIKSYILKRGFLDGKMGWQIARLNAKAVRKRYRFLKEMLKSE